MTNQWQAKLESSTWSDDKTGYFCTCSVSKKIIIPRKWKMPYLKPSAKINSEWQMSSIWHSLDMDVIFLPFWSIIHLFYIKTYIKVSIYDLNIWPWPCPWLAKGKLKRWVIRYDSLFRSHKLPFCSIQINWGFASDSLTPN